MHSVQTIKTSLQVSTFSVKLITFVKFCPKIEILTVLQKFLSSKIRNCCNFEKYYFLTLWRSIKGLFSYRFWYALRHNDANKMTSHLQYTTCCNMRHFQNYDKIDSFPKPVLNIFILGNLIVVWGILHQIHRFKGVLIAEGVVWI